LDIILAILEASRSDCQLAKILENVQEYAQLYLLAKQRQKGCDGMGEVETLREEVTYCLEKILSYCKEKGYLSDDVSFNIDSISLSLKKI